MQFRDVIGQERVKQEFVREARAGRVPHAQLIVSRQGTGGLPLAMAYAQYLNCENPGEIDSCGTCPSCRKAAHLSHPDIHFTFPVISGTTKSPPISMDFLKQWIEAVRADPYMDQFDWLQFIKAGNKQGNITARECREIIKILSLKSFEGKYKIHIIWMAEALGAEGNILLKLLEEPPENTVIILIVEHQQEVLNTILSRTQLKTLSDLDPEEIAGALESHYGVRPDKAEQIAFFADGNFHRAKKMMDDSGNELYDWLRTWLATSMNRQAVQLMELITDISGAGRERVKYFFEYLLHFFRECLSMKFTAGKPVRLVEEELVLAERIWQFANLNKLSLLVGLIQERHYHIERNVNPKYVLLDLSIRTEKILRGKS